MFTKVHFLFHSASLEYLSDPLVLCPVGGLKTWECAVDLVNYMAAHLELAGKHVIELGCGSALPGIFALMKGARVDFQDYVLPF